MIFRNTKTSEIEILTQIHLAAFKDFFLATLGRIFLNAYYKACLKSKESINVCALNEEGIMVGFGVGCIQSKGLVMPTFFGPTNIPPIEAVFSGCPVAVSGIYGMPEQMQDAALYFNPNSVEEIASAITILWTDEKKREELLRNGVKLMNLWNQDTFNKRFEMIVIDVLKLSTQK